MEELLVSCASGVGLSEAKSLTWDRYARLAGLAEAGMALARDSISVKDQGC